MAKYSFETTTVGEMLDTPEIMGIIQSVTSTRSFRR